MSNSSEPPRASYPMSVTTTVPEVSVTVFDGRDRKVHSAVGDTTVHLPPGLYRVRSELNGSIEEVFVDHTEGSHVTAPLPDEYIAAPLDRAARAHRRNHGKIAASLSVRDTTARPLCRDPQDSWLFVFVRRASSKPRSASDLGAGLSLTSATGDVLTAFDEGSVQCDPQDRYLALSAPMAHGYYMLRHGGAPPREIAVHLFRGYSTQIFLLQDAALRLDAMEVMLAPVGEPFKPADPIAHASAAGRWILQNRRGQPPPPLAAAMRDGRFANPMVGLLGAHLLLRSERPDLQIAAVIMAQLEAMLGDSPDTQALRLLIALRRKSPVPSFPIAHPPMLRPSLEALVEASRAAPDLIPPDSDLERAAVGLYLDCLFTSWTPRASARRVDASQEGRPIAEDWLQAAVTAAAAERAKTGRPLDMLALANELAVPLLTVQSTLSKIGVDVPELDARSTFTLKVTAGPMKGRVYVFREHDMFIFGRHAFDGARQSDAPLQLPPKDTKASRYHFLLEVNPPEATIRDLGSLNGTYVNGKQYGGRRPGDAPDRTRPIPEVNLHHGDLIRVGETIFECIVEIRSPSTPPKNLASTEGTGPAQGIRQERGVGGMSGAPRAPAAKSDKREPSTPAAVGGFEIIKQLGQGGMGRVYLARKPKSDELVAIKTMHPRTHASSSARRMFLREIETMKSLNHPNLIRLIEASPEGDGFFFAMEYCRGGSLLDLIARRGGKIPLDEAMPLALDALAGLECAHARGFVHRDVKPANILLSEPERGPAKVADLGIAKSLQKAGLSSMTLTGQFRGSPDFMPREQVLRFKYATPTSDVWSAGATLYYILTGAPPRTIAEGQEAIASVLENQVTPIRARAPRIPDAVAGVIDRALAQDPADRYKDASELRRALEHAL